MQMQKHFCVPSMTRRHCTCVRVRVCAYEKSALLAQFVAGFCGKEDGMSKPILPKHEIAQVVVAQEIHL